MPNRSAVILKKSDIQRAEMAMLQRLNPRASDIGPFFGSWLSRIAGLSQVAVSRGRIPPGGESFAYHAHRTIEEWIFVVEGRGRAKVDGEWIDLEAGDFVAFPVPQVPHLLTNPFEKDLIYLMGGDRSEVDVLTYPELDKSYVLLRHAGRVGFSEIGPVTYPFGPAAAAESPPLRLLATRGCGSAIVELALVLAELPYDRKEVDYSTEDGRAELSRYNPLAQVPTMILPDGRVLTESAAIVLYISELVPGADLAPAPGDPLRPVFLRWLTFLVAAVYPTFTYGDMPERWVGEAGSLLRTSTHHHRCEMWKYLEGQVGERWFLGPRFSVLDVYIAVMTRWRPRPAWFGEHCPRLTAIAERVMGHPKLAPVFDAEGLAG